MTPSQKSTLLELIEGFQRAVEATVPETRCSECEHFDPGAGFCAEWQAAVPETARPQGCERWLEAIPF